MCARFTLLATADQLADLFGLAEPPLIEPSYNVAPGSRIWMASARREVVTLRQVKWGLTASWAKPGSRPIVNARAETVAERAMFRSAFLKRRALVPISGFFEWKGTQGKRQPYYFSDPGEPVLAMAALYEPGDPETCVVLTRPAVGSALQVHERRPVLVPREHSADWLSEGPPPDPLAFVPPTLAAHPVTPRMGNVRYTGSDSIHPIG